MELANLHEKIVFDVHGYADLTANEQVTTEYSSVVVPSRKRFFELLQRCAVHQRELVAICLDCCGTRFVK